MQIDGKKIIENQRYKVSVDLRAIATWRRVKMFSFEKASYASEILKLSLPFVLLIPLSFLVIGNASASGTWEEIHHVPGADWQDVFFLDESHGWAVGWDGAVIATEDGGKNWTILHRESAAAKAPYYYASFFVSEDEGWIVGSGANQNGVIVLAENGGKRLTEHASFPGAWFHDVYFISRNEGWIAGYKDGNAFIIHTEDAGEHWEVQDEGHRGLLYKVHFVNENRGFAVGKSGAAFDNTPLVLQTDDGGRTWNRQPIPVDTGQCEDIFFLNSLEGWIAVGQSLLKTIDGGTSWESIDFPRDTWLTSVWFKDSEQGVLIGFDRSTPIYSGLIMKTEDGGQTFDKQSGFSMLNAIACFGDDSWVVGNDNSIMHSQDDENWHPQVEKAYRYTDIDFVGSDKGFLLAQSMPNWGSFGDTVILSTDDGGSNWQETGVHALKMLWCLDFVDDSSGWIGGLGGVYGTEDAGKTIQKNEEVLGNIFNIIFPTKKRGWLSGNKMLWQTLDGGATWQKVRIDLHGGINDIDALGKNAWVVGNEAGIGTGGFIYTTRDGGENFREVHIEERLYSISFATEDVGWVVGGFGTILVTDDGGRSWEAQKSGTDRYLSDVLFLSEEEGWAIGQGGIILHTDNGGNTWTEQESRSKEWLVKIVYTGGDSLFAVGDWSTILKYTDGSLSQYSERFAVPDEKLQPITWGQVKNHLYQNYPNPFNPETWIPFSISESTSVSIKIHNVSGQLVREINLGHREPGSYLSQNKAAYWDGRNQAGELISSGVYYYSIEGEFPETRKMMLMK